MYSKTAEISRKWVLMCTVQVGIVFSTGVLFLNSFAFFVNSERSSNFFHGRTYKAVDGSLLTNC